MRDELEALMRGCQSRRADLPGVDAMFLEVEGYLNRAYIGLTRGTLMADALVQEMREVSLP